LAVSVLLLVNKDQKPKQSYIELRKTRHIDFLKAGDIAESTGLLFQRDTMLDFICVLTRRKLRIKELDYDQAFFRYVEDIKKAEAHERKTDR
jgi:hypothetical protein